MTKTSPLLALVTLGLPLVAGCPSDPPASTADASVGVDAPVVAEPDAAIAPTCDPVDPACEDQSISQLDFFDTVNPTSIAEEGTTAGEFTSVIDATAGGMNPTESYVYARFTPEGLEKVELSDEDAFGSTGWDIAFRRFIIRLNSGVSGPSCVEGARTAPATTFETLTEAPASLSYHREAYFTEGSCDLVPDGSGLGSPATVLSSFWEYPGCVKMTGNVYVVRLADGRLVKLQVLGYYPPENQEACDTTGTVPVPSGGGRIRVRWAFLG